MKPDTQILFCACAHADIVPPQVRSAVLDTLRAAGIRFEVVSDLCELAARKSAKLARLAAAEDLRIAACHPRAVRWLLEAGGASRDASSTTVMNMRTQSAQEIVAGLLGEQAQLVGDPDESALPTPASGAWMPWFPVIDFDRCTNCGQCLDFCLFDVFRLDADGRIEVANPENCKTGCPACARVCPEIAIIFPKHLQRPINGDEPRGDDPAHEPIAVDLRALADQDVREALRARSGKERRRFAVPPHQGDQPPPDKSELRRLQAEFGMSESVLREFVCECECRAARFVNGKPDASIKPCCEAGSPDSCCSCTEPATPAVGDESQPKSCSCCDSPPNDTPRPMPAPDDWDI